MRIKYGIEKHPLYVTYRNMVKRCTNPYPKDASQYKDRGITVCERWTGVDGFKNFITDMPSKPEGTSLDRIDNEKGYSPDNCRWATPRQQALNTRKNNAHPNIYFAKHRNKYYVQYMLDGKRVSKGNYETLEEALSVRDKVLA